jgi:hypothetical protein
MAVHTRIKPRRRLAWIRAAALTAIAVACLANGVTSAMAGPGANGPNGWQYSYDNGHCIQAGYVLDPIGIFFQGPGAHFTDLAGSPAYGIPVGHITYHNPDWTRHLEDPTSYGGRQSFFDFSTGECRQNPADTDLSTANGYGNNRRHMRMWTNGIPDGDSWTTYTTPHKEKWACGGTHRVTHDNAQGYSGFDLARREIMYGFRTRGDRHPMDNLYWGNTHSVKQCNGDWVASNGHVGRIQINNAPGVG